MTVLEDVPDAANHRAVFEIDVRIVFKGEPWVIRNHPSVVHFVIGLASFQEMSYTGISSSVRRITIIVDDSFLAKSCRENFGTFVAIHTWRTLV